MSNSALTPQAFQDFREASVSQNGLISTGSQSFSGNKTFFGLETFGPSSHTADLFHTIRFSGLSFSLDADRGLGGNCYVDQYRNWNRTGSGTNGAGITFNPNASANGTALTFYVNQAGDSLSTPADAAGSYTGNASWTLGILGGTEIHRAYGSEFRLQGESSNGTQLSAARTKLLAPVRQNIAPSSSGTFENGQAGAIHIVKGYGTGDNASKRFTDFVVTTESGWTTPTAVLHSSGINSPNSRTYTVDGSNRLVVSLGSGGTNNFEVNVAVFSI